MSALLIRIRTRNLLAEKNSQLRVIGFGFRKDTHSRDVTAVGKVEQLVHSTVVRLLVEIDDLDVAVREGYFGKVEFGFAVKIQKQSVAGFIDAKVGIDPLFVARDCFAVLPCESFARRQGDDRS